MKRFLSMLICLWVVLLSAAGCQIADFFNPFRQASNVVQVPQEKTVITGQNDILTEIYPTHGFFAPVQDEEKMHYRDLPAHLKQAYGIVNYALTDMTQGVIDLGECTEREMLLVYKAVINDHPEYFWVSSHFLYWEDTQGNCDIAFSYEDEQAGSCRYRMDRQTRDDRLASVRQSLEQAATLLKPDMGEYERELALHTWLCEKTAYEKVDSTEAFAHTSYSALVDGRATCQGYARAMQLLLHFAGIQSSVVLGSSQNEGHMWNIVRIDGAYYHLDVTWNDTDDLNLHSYFNLTDAQIKADHTIDPVYTNLGDDAIRSDQFNFKLPACELTQANFFERNGTMIRSQTQFAPVVAGLLKATAELGMTACEFSFAADMRQLYSPEDDIFAEQLMNAAHRANEALQKGQQITSIWHTGLPGSLAFRVEWTLE